MKFIVLIVSGVNILLQMAISRDTKPFGVNLDCPLLWCFFWFLSKQDRPGRRLRHHAAAVVFFVLTCKEPPGKWLVDMNPERKGPVIPLVD